MAVSLLMHQALQAGLTVLALGLVARADQVRLKNGHVIEGILLEDTSAGIVLTVAGGSVAFPRSSIDSVVKAPADENALLQSSWKEKRFLDKSNVPLGFEGLADQTRNLGALRAQAGTGADLKAVADYRAGIHACSQALDAAESTPFGNSPEGRRFLERVRDQLRLAQAEFRQTTLHPERRGNAYCIRVLVNDRTEANVILDTGAELTSLSRDFAKRAGLSETGRVASVGIADGSRFDALVVRVDSIRIGDVIQRQSEAVLLPHAPDEGIDGLLGMNVLRAFQLRFDPTTNLLQLEQYQPSKLH